MLDTITAARPSSATAGWTCSPPTTSAGPCTKSRLRQPAGGTAQLRSLHLPRSRRRPRLLPRWEIAADTCVAILRTEAGRDPHDKDLHDLVGELSTRSSDFRRRWGTHDVRLHGAGTKRFHHGVVGDLDLSYESIDLVSDPGLTLTLYAAEPGSASANALDLLASWQATELAETAATAAIPAQRSNRPT